MTLFFSPSRRGFIDDALFTGALPEDALEITPAQRDDVTAALGEGLEVSVMDGQLVIPETPKADREALTAEAVASIKTEARIRILGVVPYWRQMNDAAALSLGYDDGALSRRVWIDAMRAYSNDLEASLSGLSDDDLAAYDPAAQAWPEAPT
ncbi:hypothetical protein JDBV08_00485 [Mycobacterium phage jiawei]|nr:hypothetical protein JDBV08_00485 [Mycobacterium phage jiawei]